MDADFYMMKYFNDKFSSKNFFEVQRLAHPFLVGEIPSNNKIVYTLLSNYSDRIKDKESLERVLDNFINSGKKRIVDSKEVEKALSLLSYNDLIYYNDLAEVSIYKGRYGRVCDNVKYNYYGSNFETNVVTEDGLPYAHFEYDNIVKDFLKMIELEKNYRFAQAILDRYGDYNVRDLTYDDLVRIMTSMVTNYNYDYNSSSSSNTDYSRLFHSISDIASIYDDYSLDSNLQNISLKKLSLDKLIEFNSILILALDLLKYGDKDLMFSSFMLIKNSDVVIDITRLDEAISVCENNDVNTINKFRDDVSKEISNRRNKSISHKLVDDFMNDVKSSDNTKILKK